MGSHGIRDKVAIAGMGRTSFGGHCHKPAGDLLVESPTAAAGTWLQLRGEAPERRRLGAVGDGRSLALTPRPRRGPGECVSFVSVVGTERSA